MSPLDAHGRPRTTLLLGGRSEIGMAIVDRIMDGTGGKLILAGRNMTAGESDGVEALEFDALDTDGHATFFDDVFDRHVVDAVVVAFGVLEDQSDIDAEPGLMAKMGAVNYLGAASSLLHCAARLRHQGSGVLVVLSSVAGMVPRSNFAYGSTKAGVDFLARGLARSLEGTGVDVLVVRPGFVHTAMTSGMKPAPFSVSPGRVADEVASALAARRSVAWAPPILKWVMLVLRLLPHSVARRLEG